MKIKISLLLLAIVTKMTFAQTGSITNVTASQRTDGSMIVDIYYDLAGSQNLYKIDAEASLDGGASFTPINLVNGDIGYDVATEISKHIIWNFGSEYPGSYNTTTKIRLTASNNCGFVLEDSRDGQSYNTVQIGNQCWMQENLNIGTMIPGINSMSNDGIIEKYCFYNLSANCDMYGGLYQFDEMMQYTNITGSQGICPTGWHIPSDEDWCEITQFIDPTINCNIWDWNGTDAGGKMKSTGTIEEGTGMWHVPNTGATNLSGFTALPGAARYNPGDWINFQFEANFWSSSTYDTDFAWDRSFDYSHADVGRFHGYKLNGYSVRCLRDLNN
jgi:uncharacterized protein (TIGR02145 family)